MSDNKYPYIGEGTRSGNVVLFTSSRTGEIIVRGESVTDSFNVGYQYDSWSEKLFKNITREYLTNTYGKCESQEHADFICKLAWGHGFNVINNYSKSKGRIWFIISGSKVEFFSNQHNTKLIHLPLPPKEKEMPEVKEQKPVYTKEMHERGEKPPVGSLVWWGDYSECEVLINKPDVDGCIVLLTKDVYVFAELEDIKPIPTIEDEMNKILSNHYDAGGMDEDLIKKFLDKFNITPKGE